MPSPQPDEEDLKRLGLDPADYKTRSEFQNALREKIGSLSRAQQSAFTGLFMNLGFNFEKYNITTYTAPYGIKEYVRYSIPGMRGAFGYARAAAFVRQVMEE